MTDPISDMLTRIRNAQAVGKTEVILPWSKIKFHLAEVLHRNGYIKSAEVLEPSSDNRFKQIRVTLKYVAPKTGAIKKIKRVSTPGSRVYVKQEELPVVLNHLGIAIISTSQGLMTNKEARNKKLGGEVLCEVY
ncbi:MAG: 30S ribosomal protein S8 [Candidatus Buchananbacteria bacterium CG10_big_fil_rev_8_21_14_0_10_42_9]|uniref:Small ribosomal subunit protein uS8 n=1 Tax=Candidatus Buchananbacteria bacterium CG10_big_fil_rev_8_21_14_0_10_42_9 TaxID=1974526 RepID=A0A2H0W250_9BACT|nr:MAG: 30S ribosomal protein S8 [Candidatus Buchananbacteria bacterium CG10_big_fil_rev_8_21_14_0_10_42_9]